MKELWKILMGILKGLDPIGGSLLIAIMGLSLIGGTVSIVKGFFEMISEIVIALSGQPLG